MGQLLVPLNATAFLIAVVGWGVIVLFQWTNAPLVALGFWMAGVVGPGLGWARWVGVSRESSAAGFLLGQSLALGLLIILGLVAALLGMPLTTGPLLLLLLLAMALSIVSARRPGVVVSVNHSVGGAALILVMLVALALRLPSLGYSEFQGDEVEAVLRAGALANGQPSAIFYHAKAPGEVILAGLVYGLGNTINELGTRLPFALAGVLAVGTMTVLGGELFGRRAGYVVGGLGAIAGYYIAFARITQYQSLVLAFGTAAILAATTARGDAPRRIWAAGALMGAGLLCHYDALFSGVPVLLLALASLQRDGKSRGARLKLWLGGAGVALAIPLLFFLPYSLSPLAEQGVARITGRVGEIALRNNLPAIAAAASLYLSTPFIAVIAAIALTGGVVAPVILPKQRLAWVICWCWLALPILGYGFIVRKPGTHAHVALLPTLMMTAAALSAMMGYPRVAALNLALTLALILTALPVAAHDVGLYLVNQREAVRNNDVPQLPLGMLTLPVPRKERFGFPYQAGWKAIGNLFETGALTGSYDSNENPQVTWWYTRGAWRCTANPRYYVISEQVQDEIEPPRRRIATDYSEVASVTVHGEVKTHVYEKKPMAGPVIGQIEAERAADHFDQLLAEPLADPGVWARGPVSPLRTAMNLPFADVARFLGYRVYPEDPRPGGVVRLDSYWLALFEGERFVPVVTIGDEPAIGSNDHPGCDKSRAWAEWHANRLFAQRNSIPISEQAQPGTYPLYVRLVDSSTGKLVPSAGTNAETVLIGAILINAP